MDLKVKAESLVYFEDLAFCPWRPRQSASVFSVRANMHSNLPIAWSVLNVNYKCSQLSSTISGRGHATSSLVSSVVALLRLRMREAGRG